MDRIVSSYLPVELHKAYDMGDREVLCAYCDKYMEQLGGLVPSMNRMFVVRLPSTGLHGSLIVQNRRGYSVRGGMVASAHPFRYGKWGEKNFGVQGSALSKGDLVVYIKLAEKIFYWRGIEVCVVFQPDVMMVHNWNRKQVMR